MLPLLHRLAAGSLVALSVGCVSVSTPDVLLATTPRGAAVWIDGQLSGHATPCHVELHPDRPHRVRFVLDGYEPREVVLQENPGIDTSPWTWGYGVVPGRWEFSVVPWSDGVFAFGRWRAPLFLPYRDFLIPIRVDPSLHPSRLHIRLQPVEEG